MIAYDQFIKSLADRNPPKQLPVPLQALWYEANGDWDKAHRLVQKNASLEASWVHAYLHRKQGDNINAGYWYSKAEHPFPDLSLDDEWQRISKTLLSE